MLKKFSDKAKKMVAEQIIVMLYNNVISGQGYESLVGWLEDGDVFFNAEEGYSDSDIDEAMALVREISENMDAVSLALNVEPSGIKN